MGFSGKIRARRRAAANGSYIKGELRALNDNTFDEADVVEELGFNVVETEE